jgi:hypothetical protein
VSFGTAHDGLDAGDEFVLVERLGEVIVGTYPETLDLVLGASQAGQDQDWCLHLGKVQQQHGAAAIAWLRQNNKLHYVKIAAQLIPKEFVMKDQSINDLSDEQISEMLAYLADEMGRKHAKVIDNEVVEQKADKSGD